MPVLIRLLDPHDAPAYRRVRLRALAEDPAAFLSDAATYAASPLEDDQSRLAANEHRFTLGAFVDGELVGIASLFRSTRQKQAHRADVTGVYVAPHQRGQGAAQALISGVIERARAMPGLDVLELGVGETQSAAQRLYTRSGFERWGVQPDAIRLGGQSLTEFYMQLRLRTPRTPPSHSG